MGVKPTHVVKSPAKNEGFDQQKGIQRSKTEDATDASNKHWDFTYETNKNQMVVKPAKNMDLTMEMVKKSRLFQQNGGENPQLATING